MKPALLLARLRAGDPANVRFTDCRRPIEAAGFRQVRVKEGHHIFRHPEVPSFLNLQNVGGVAKLYQIRRFLRTLNRYSLVPGDSA